MLKRFRLDACCLTILIFLIYVLICLRMPRDHATPDFPDLNMNIYGVKHEHLWG